MFKTLGTIIGDNWSWRGQIWRLALTEMQKEVRGTALGWVWLLLTPAIYVAVLWVALAIGLRTVSPVESVPYVAWLTAGVIPWQFCSSMITGGSNIYRRYPYLVNRMRFPISVISSFYTLARLIVFIMTLSLVVVVMIATGMSFSIYLVQLPLLIIVMFLFWLAWSLLTSPLSAISKDFHALIRALATPLFWVSGVFFDVSSIQIPWVQTIFAINPAAFFVMSIRGCFVEDFWIWQRPLLMWPFLAVFLVTVIAALVIQKRLSTEVADVL